MGYLSTWSAVKEYQTINKQNPLELIYNKLESIPIAIESTGKFF
jgi:hypothetical protein